MRRLHMSLICSVVFLMVLPILFSVYSQPAYASFTVDISIPRFQVQIDHQSRDNLFQRYPIILYKDVLYFPLTYFDSQTLGLDTVWSGGRLSVSKSVDTLFPLQEQLIQKENPPTDLASIVTFPVQILGKHIDNANAALPLLLYRNITYTPWTEQFAEEIGSVYRFDQSKGLRIMSCNYIQDNPRLAGAMMLESYLEFTFEGDRYLVEIDYPPYGLPWPDNLLLSKNGEEPIRIGDKSLYYGILSEESDPSSTSMYSVSELKFDSPWILVHATTEGGVQNGLFQIHVLTGETKMVKAIPLQPK